jgi:hypothetical protein
MPPFLNFRTRRERSSRSPKTPSGPLVRHQPRGDDAYDLGGIGRIPSKIYAKREAVLECCADDFITRPLREQSSFK